MNKPRVIAVTAAIVRRSGEILLARRRSGSHLEGLWEFPGGKIEEGESPEECLVRELKEEFSLESTVGAFVASNRHHYGEKEIKLLAYEVELAQGNPTLNSHDEIRWVRLEELLDYQLAPADIPIAKKLVEGR